MTQAELLDRDIAAAFYGRFSSLRPAQEAVIEPLVQGRNVVLTAGTGSGKTEAVLAPILSRSWRRCVSQNRLGYLYIAPTKALANDIRKRLQSALEPLGIQVGIRHGDQDDLVSGPNPNLLITTPESLDVLLHRGEPRLQLIEAVIIDEVHLLYNTQRGLQLSILLQRLSASMDKGFQWAAMSATVGELSYIKDFIFGVDSDAVLIDSPSQRYIDAHVRNITDSADLLALVKRIIEGHTKLLLFANSRRECERLAHILASDEALKGRVFTHYSSLSAESRRETEERFASVTNALCIATSTLELGIDIGDINAVVLWGVPQSIESFLQRIGRGNRKSNKTNAICLIPDTSDSIALDALRFLALLQTATEGDLGRRQPHELFGAFCQQTIGIISSRGGSFTRIADLHSAMGPRLYLDRPAYESILDSLVAQDYLKRHGFKNQVGAGENLHRLVDLKMIFGNFPVASQKIPVRYEGKLLGEVPVANLLRLRVGDVLRFMSKTWKLRKLSRDEIKVETCSGVTVTAEFTYGGMPPSIDPHLLAATWRLLFDQNLPENVMSKSLLFVVQAYRDSYRSHVCKNEIPCRRLGTSFQYETFAGYIINRAVGLLTQSVPFKANDYILEVSTPIDWSALPGVPEAYDSVYDRLYEDNPGQSLFQQLLPLDLRLKEFLQSWLRDDTVRETLARLSGARTVDI